jgi:protein phosphatase-4 regulatory subunit 3
VLEYNPSLAERIPHRQFITEKAVFREVIPLKDADVLALIHHTFQLQYLRV